MSYNDDVLGNRGINQRGSAARAFTQAAKRTTHVLLPDTCTVRALKGADYTIDVDGIATYTAAANRTYRNSEAIPCRADDVRSFRPDEFPSMPAQVVEWDLQLPLDFTCDETDIVTLDGSEYKIRKLSASSDWMLTKVAKIMKLGDNLD